MVKQVTVCPACSASIDEANKMRAFLHETSKRAAEEAERAPYPLTPAEKEAVQDHPATDQGAQVIHVARPAGRLADEAPEPNGPDTPGTMDS